MATSKRKRFQLTSLSTEEKQRLGGYIKRLGGILIDTQIFSKLATHVICGFPNRGEKFLGGAALGKWILKREFVEESFAQGKWLEEEEYEWSSKDIDEKKELAMLFDAPRQWRLYLQGKASAFQNWKALVYMQEMKMKKAYERLLTAGDATVYKKKVSLQHLSKLPDDLTHVFVETKLHSDVQQLRKKGILVLSVDYIPDFIIQGPKETFITSNSKIQPKKELMQLNRVDKPVLHCGKENGSFHDTRNKNLRKRGIKRAMSDCELCEAKRKKTTQQDLPPHINLNVMKSSEKQSTTIFPDYIANILESCIDEECPSLAIESLLSSLSQYLAPTARWLHVIMNQLLLNAPSKQQSYQCYNLLHNILEVHPPAGAHQSLYLAALEEPRISNSQEEQTPSQWEFFSKVIRYCLEKDENNGKEMNIQANAILLLKFLDKLIKVDSSNANQQTAIITHVLWPRGNDVIHQSHNEVKEFITLCCKVLQTIEQNENESSVADIMLDWLSIAATLMKHDDITGRACEFLVQQLYMEMSKSNCELITKFFLERCNCTWLKMKILELILANYDKRLIPHENKQFLDKTLKLNKIVFCYFFLLPNTKDCGTVEKRTKAKRKRKNGKGETPLHIACIQNNAERVEQLLKHEATDVNIGDNAGWTALHEASNRGYVDCVKKILQYHERTNKVNLLTSPQDNGITVLHDAVLNNHLDIVRLLTRAGGLQLLQAKNTAGKTALELAKANPDIALFLSSELEKLQSIKCRDDINTPTLDEYQKIFNKRKCCIPMEECEKYVLYVSQLVQCYVQEHLLLTDNQSWKDLCTYCENDVKLVKNFENYLITLEEHIKNLCGRQTLSILCQFYFTSMKLCVSFI